VRWDTRVGLSWTEPEGPGFELIGDISFCASGPSVLSYEQATTIPCCKHLKTWGNFCVGAHEFGQAPDLKSKLSLGTEGEEDGGRWAEQRRKAG
jgi:hypothetical protein